MTGSIRRYISAVDPGGRVVIIKSDGTPFTESQKKWIDAAVTKALRAELAAGMHGTYPDEVLDSEDTLVRVKPDGERVHVHPLMIRLKQIIKLRGWAYAQLSQFVGRSKSLVSRYIRGEMDPHLKDAAALFGLLGYRLVAAPLDVLDEVNEVIARKEEEIAKALHVHSMGAADE